MNKELIDQCLKFTATQPSAEEVVRLCYKKRLLSLDKNIHGARRSMRSAEVRTKKLSDLLYIISCNRKIITRTSALLSAVIKERGLTE